MFTAHIQIFPLFLVSVNFIGIVSDICNLDELISWASAFIFGANQGLSLPRRVVNFTILFPQCFFSRFTYIYSPSISCIPYSRSLVRPLKFSIFSWLERPSRCTIQIKMLEKPKLCTPSIHVLNPQQKIKNACRIN